VESRLGALEREVSDLKVEVKDLRREISLGFDRMYERVTSLIRWTIGTLALFGTLITILLTVSQFLK